METIKPPRALWVPFELGRPLGGWVDTGSTQQAGGFQRSVLSAALALFDEKGVDHVLKDFAEDDPGMQPDTDWAMPALPECQSIAQEVEQLQPAWQQWLKQQGSSKTGLSGMKLDDAVAYLERYEGDNPMANPADDMSDVLRLRYCSDDIKTFYIESAMHQGQPSSKQIGNWFWKHTYAGKYLNNLRAKNLQHEHERTRFISEKFLVPGAWQ